MKDAARRQFFTRAAKAVVLTVAVVAVASAAMAVETTASQAQTAVRNWVKRNAHPMATGLVSGDGVARTFRNDAGRTLFHAVELDGGGFVVASGDTKESPIVAFSDSGTFDATMKNPLYALIVQHMSAAADAIDASATNTSRRTLGLMASSPSATAAESPSEGEWAELLDDSTTVTVGGRSSWPRLRSTSDTSDSMITDMRVPPLCPSQWSQQGWNASGYAFNYYTPSNYPCGCTATAMAQIMYRWKMPTGYVAPRAYQCTVGGAAETITTMGGNYAWSTMPISMVRQYSATLSERQAVGHILHDVGVSIRSSYTSGGTGSYGFFIPGALKENFGYTEGKVYYIAATYGSDASAWSVLENGVYASLDAQMPVALSIHNPLSGSKSGHCVVLDGYGYIGSTRWTHLNSGWAGKSDAWYQFFTETLTSMDYTYLQEFVYNMHPTIAGDVISGRVTDHTGAPVAGATVTRTLSGVSQTTSTDEYGIYYFRVTSGGTYTLSATKGGLSSGTRSTSVTIGTSCSFSSTFTGSGWSVYNVKNGGMGNRWGQDLQLAAPALERLELSGPSSVNCGKSAQYEATAYYTDGSVKTVTALSTWSLTSGSSYGVIGSSTGLLSTYETYETGRSVTIKAVYNTKTANKVVSIVPIEEERVFTTLSLTGPGAVEGGSTASYTAVAGFDDGSTSNVTLVAAWSLSSGSSYGSIGTSGASAGVLTAYETTERGRSVTVRVSWTYKGVTKTAELPVAILFTERLRRPVSLTINGASTLAAGMTTPYTATVAYNDGTSDVDVTLGSSWSLTQSGSYAVLKASSSRQELKAYGFSDAASRTVTVKALYSETCGKVGGGTETVTVNGSKVVTITPSTSIPEAVDVKKDGTVIYDLEFTTGSTIDGNCWYGQTGKYHYDGDAAQSGFMSGSYGQNWLQTTVSGAGTFSFWWNVSSEPMYDHLKFEIDGIQYGASISGVTNAWTQVVAPLGAGDHVLRWTYVKDEMNDYGEDAGWVDKIEWTPLAPPAAPVVTATDGESTEEVVVTWTVPPSARPVAVYEVARSADGGSIWTNLASSATGTNWSDKTAVPGVDYTYRVRAANDAGWGAYGSDTGWRKVALSVAPDSIMAPFTGEGVFTVAVTSAVAWTVSSETWAVPTPSSGTSNGTLVVTFDANSDIAERSGTLTVTAGPTPGHQETANVTILQQGRPVRCDIGFCRPYDDWRIPLQIGDAAADATLYSPVSVFGSDEDLAISFGWTNRGESVVSMPGVKFTVLDVARNTVVEWRDAARPGETLSPTNGEWSGNWPCGIVQVLDPGDYMLVAELDPDDTLSDTDRSDNTNIFRFAVADRSLREDSVFSSDAWTNVEFKVGNDFAQAPHVAVRPVPSGEAFAESVAAQFGPYTPMNGLVGRMTSGKAPLDLVFLIDVTGSMGGCINGLKTNIREFFNALVTGDADNPPITDWRAKVIGFRDVTCDRSWYEDHGFTTDVGEFNSHIALCVATGGGDGPESLLDAVWRIAKETDFREGASRAIVAFTDAPYKSPMSYGGASGLGVAAAVAAAKEAGINLQLIASPYSGGSDLRAFAEAISEDSSYTQVSGLSTTTLDGEMLRRLAKAVSSGVKETEIVEPMLSANLRGRGTLSFDWKNDSTAGTNNTFTFVCDAATNIVNDARTGWKHVSLNLEEGWHYVKWTYGKLFYEGDVTDCGVLANVNWKPYETELEIVPSVVQVDYLGTNKADLVYGATFEVMCNSVWKTVKHDDWITIVRGDGDGNGELVVNVETNLAYTSRTGYITVRAGEYGRSTDKILERTVMVVQDPHPYVEDGVVHLLDVDVKPRWPWNGFVDIDFRVVAPAKGTATTITFKGKDGQGTGFTFATSQPWREQIPWASRCNGANDSNVRTPGVTYAELTTSGDNDARFTCPSSGVYRITWDVGRDWWSSSSNYKMFNHENTFHSPNFSVEMTASASGSTDTRSSREVRVDTRQSSYLGGLIASGDELVGHSNGKIDPIKWDSTSVVDGEYNPGLLFDVADRTDQMTNKICVVNGVAVEGGTLTSNTLWKSGTVHLIRHHVFVPANVTLTVEEGAILKFCEGAKIFCNYYQVNGVGNWNLALQGCYMAAADNVEVGGDTLNGCAIRDSSMTFAIGDGYFFDKDFPEKDSNMYSSDSKGIIKVILEVLIENTHEYRIWRTRYYTRNQVYGRLPHPVYSGEEFYGWILRGTNPWSDFDSLDIESPQYKTNYRNVYIAMTNSIVHSTDIVFTDGYAWSNDGKTLYAYSDTKENQPDNFSERIDGSSAQITLSPATAVYNGSEQKPTVVVKVDEAVVPPENYDIVWGGDFTSVGTHAVTIAFKWDYTGSPATTFEITPCDASGATVTLSPASARYSGSEQKPSVSVSLGGTTIAASDYEVVWGEGDWTSVGSYVATVMFTGNYTGEVSATFEIEENPDLRVVFYGSRAAALARQAESGARRPDGSKRRILFISGRDDDVSTRYVKRCLSEVPRIRNFVQANFVCWYDDCDAAGTEYPTYVRGLESVALPLVAALDATDGSKRVLRKLTLGEDVYMRSSGYMSEDQIYEFVQAAAAEPDDASSAGVTLSATSFEWDGTEKKPTVSVVYGGMPVPGENYTVKYSTDSPVSVGRYTAWVEFDHTRVLTGYGYALGGETVPIKFSIVPKTYTSSDVSLSPASAVYDGTMHRPTVVVADPLAAYTVDYGDGDYIVAGNYTVKVKFGGGATGEVVKAFSISRADAREAVVTLDWYSAKANGAVKKPYVVSVVYGDYTFGADEYDVSYFGDCKNVGEHRVDVTFKGNWTGTASASFRLEEDLLPADPGDIGAVIDGFGLLNADDRARLKTWIGDDVGAYNMFRTWVDAVGVDAVRGSSRVYESFRISMILAAPQLLGDGDDIKIKISEFDMGEGGHAAWNLTVRIVCEGAFVRADEEGTVEFMLSAAESAKAAFADMIRRSTSLGGLEDGRLDPTEDIAATLEDEGYAVKLSVAPPSGTSGFMTLKFE